MQVNFFAGVASLFMYRPSDINMVDGVDDLHCFSSFVQFSTEVEVDMYIVRLAVEEVQNISFNLGSRQ